MSADRANRPAIVGADSGPEAPFPLRLEGPVIRGFGRGSAELGIPTANIPVEGLTVGGRSDIDSGIYFGFAGLHAPSHVHRTSSIVGHAGPSGPAASGLSADASAPESAVAEPDESPNPVASDASHAEVYPMVMSVGWNPFYQNTKRSVEIHLLARFPHDFYGAHMRLSMLGFVRPELDYVSRDALIEDIRTDIAVTQRSLARPAWQAFAAEEWLLQT